MSPAASTAVALVALLLAGAAIVLATIANRRWASRAAGSRGPGATPGPGPGDGGAPSPAADRPGADANSEGDRARESLAAAVSVLRSEVDGLAEHVDALRARSTAAGADLEALRAHVEDLAVGAEPVSDPTALRHVALVRYDAFADVGGRLSYSVALLDDTGSGLVLTTLSGKSDVRTYVRTISAGTPDGSLTAEEQQAIEAAVGSRQ